MTKPEPLDKAHRQAADAGFDPGDSTFTPRPARLPGNVRKVAPGLWVRDAAKPKKYKGSKAAKKAAKQARKRGR